MTTKTIKDVNEKTWRKLRLLSTEYNMKMGSLLEKITEDYEKRGREFWKFVLDGEKILSDREAEELKSVSKALRNERGFR